MPIQNTEIADIFSELADLLEIREENQYRIRAYRNAARVVGGHSTSVADMISRGEELSALPGIGKDLAYKMKQIVETGSLPQLEKLRSDGGTGLSEIMKIGGLGPKRTKTLHKKLGIRSVQQLEKAARSGEVRSLPGFGEKIEKAILESIERRSESGNRMRLNTAEQIAGPLVEELREVKGVKLITIAGSYRRRVETVGDLDVLVTCAKDSPVMDAFVNYEDVRKVVAHGKTKSSVVLRSGLQVDVRVVPEASYGAALHYFTGSKAHNIAVRKRGVKKNLKINEYGVFRGDRRVAGKTEKDVYGSVKLAYIEPELREDTGEIDAAAKGRLPHLITQDQVLGDLHMHSRYTDGTFSIEEMALAAQRFGYEYVAMTDHSRKIRIARGMDEKTVRKQIREIDRVNEKLKGIVVLKGIELDILEDGSLDLSDSVLAELDFAVCSVHSKFNLSRREQTRRIAKALENRYCAVLAHPTGRIIGTRPPYEMDMEEIMKVAREEGCFLEVNGNPERLDLSDVHCRLAKDAGVQVSLGTDAHGKADLGFMKYAVSQARRGWLEAADIVNTRGLNDVVTMLKRKR